MDTVRFIDTMRTLIMTIPFTEEYLGGPAPRVLRRFERRRRPPELGLVQGFARRFQGADGLLPSTL